MGAGAIVSQVAACTGILVGAIALGGFLAHVGPALEGAREDDLRKATARGGLEGLKVGSAVIVLSAIIDRLT
jgi:hypothetical protein